jgi:hypothetical protein
MGGHIICVQVSRWIFQFEMVITWPRDLCASTSNTSTIKGQFTYYVRICPHVITPYPKYKKPKALNGFSITCLCKILLTSVPRFVLHRWGHFPNYFWAHCLKNQNSRMYKFKMYPPICRALAIIIAITDNAIPPLASKLKSETKYELADGKRID